MFWPLIFMFRPAVCIAYFPYMPWGRDSDRYLTICLIHSLRNYWTIWTIGQAENSSWTTLLHGGDVGYNPPWTSAVIICTHLSRDELQSKRFATETMLIQTNLVLAPPPLLANTQPRVGAADIASRTLAMQLALISDPTA